ncbi:MAG: hypothetical protein RJA70_3327 [Pseudomonadota bacterium]|jgi:hypothetical protein
MKISVYDTYVQRPDGLRMHFDILVPSDLSDPATVLSYGQIYLASKGLPSSILKSEKCKFCHVESANAAVAAEIADKGFSIIEMEHCD